uniref:Uncharacterized protein n=1 Tax=Anguilla anguilla TaxID=7936 RepID=A0A0E9TGY3_ANGAN
MVQCYLLLTPNCTLADSKMQIMTPYRSPLSPSLKTL